MEALRKRFQRWMLAAGIGAASVSALAVFGREPVFGVVAAFLWFFSWNRWMELRRVQRVLTYPAPTTAEEVQLWTRFLESKFVHPRRWEKASQWVAGLTALGLCLLVSFAVIITSGFWMRMLYASTYAVLLLVAIYAWRLKRREAQREVTEPPSHPDPWSDLT